MAADVSNGGRGPLVELGALHELLDGLKPDDSESTSAWYSSSEPCCKEIIHRFRNLLDKWASDWTRVQRSLATGSNLTKCVHCGVIRRVESSEVEADDKKRRSLSERRSDVRTIPERDERITLNVAPSVRPVTRYTRKQEIMRNSQPIVPHHKRPEVPTHLDKSTMRENRRNAIAKKPSTKIPRVSDKIVNRSIEKNTTPSPVVDKCSEKGQRKCEDDEAKNHSLMETVRYLVKENVAARENCASKGKHRFALHEDEEKNHPLMENVKYFVKENAAASENCASQRKHRFALHDDEEKNHPLMEIVKYLVKENAAARENCASRGKHDFALHGSRDTDIHDGLGFVVYDRWKLHDDKLRDQSCRVQKEVATKADGFDEPGCAASHSPLNGDSANVPVRGSDTSAFSSSSAENLIRQWIKPSRNVRHVNAEPRDFSFGIGVTETKDSPPLMKDLAPETKHSLSGVKNLPTEMKHSLPATRNLPPGIAVGTTRVINNGRSSKAHIHEGEDNSCDQREVDGKKNNPTVSQLSDCPNDDDSSDVTFVKMLNKPELPGISTAMENTIWDHNKISISSTKAPAVTSKTRDKSLAPTVEMTSSGSCNRDDLVSETSERFEREILYEKISSHDVISESAMTTAASKVLLIYRKILESSEEMDWQSFENLVSALHPSQRELWCEICRAVSNEAKRLAEETGATTEVCIELNPLPSKKEDDGVRRCGDEFSFELDLTLKDVHIVVENACTALSKKCKKISKPEKMNK